jgi:hypothetical protein
MKRIQPLAFATADSFSRLQRGIVSNENSCPLVQADTATTQVRPLGDRESSEVRHPPPVTRGRCAGRTEMTAARSASTAAFDALFADLHDGQIAMQLPEQERKLRKDLASDRRA